MLSSNDAAILRPLRSAMGAAMKTCIDVGMEQAIHVRAAYDAPASSLAERDRNANAVLQDPLLRQNMARAGLSFYAALDEVLEQAFLLGVQSQTPVPDAEGAGSSSHDKPD